VTFPEFFYYKSNSGCASDQALERLCLICRFARPFIGYSSIKANRKLNPSSPFFTTTDHYAIR